MDSISVRVQIFGTATEQDFKQMKVAIAKTRCQSTRVNHLAEHLSIVVDYAAAEQRLERKRIAAIVEQLNHLQKYIYLPTFPTMMKLMVIKRMAVQESR